MAASMADPHPHPNPNPTLARLPRRLLGRLHGSLLRPPRAAAAQTEARGGVLALPLVERPHLGWTGLQPEHVRLQPVSRTQGCSRCQMGLQPLPGRVAASPSDSAHAPTRRALSTRRAGRAAAWPRACRARARARRTPRAARVAPARAARSPR
eukprot:scaffold16428_cov63-Phaeocystis_antarctica.AAC.2